VISKSVPQGPDESSPASAAADWVSVFKERSVPNGTIDRYWRSLSVVRTKSRTFLSSRTRTGRTCLFCIISQSAAADTGLLLSLSPSGTDPSQLVIDSLATTPMQICGLGCCRPNERNERPIGYWRSINRFPIPRFRWHAAPIALNSARDALRKRDQQSKMASPSR
jgi:hypothetical protein